MMIRSQASTLAKQCPQHKTRLPRVLVMTDEQRLPDPVAAARAMPTAWGLIFRHYGVDDRHALARQTVNVCKSRGLVCLIGGDWRLAEAVGADGVHLPEAMTKCALAPLQLWRQRGKLMTMSAHGRYGLLHAMRLDADGVLLSPVERTASHPDQPTLGSLRFAAWTRLSGCPVIALGGITLSQQNRLSALGAAGIAGIGLLKGAS